MEKFTSTPTQSTTVYTVDGVIDAFNAHAANTSNPHKVTAAQLGLGSALQWKGSVNTFADLPAKPSVGWTYNVKTGDNTHAAGMNFAWNGSEWDDLGGTLKGLVRSINGNAPDDAGNIVIHGTPELPNTETFYKGTGVFSNEITEVKVDKITAKKTAITATAPIQGTMVTGNNSVTLNNTTSVYYITPTATLTLDVSGLTVVSGCSRVIRVYIDMKNISNEIQINVISGSLTVLKNDLTLSGGRVYAINVEILGNNKVYIGMPISGSRDLGDPIDDDTINSLFAEGYIGK